MAIKIMIDAGHGGYDNGATYGNRREKDDALDLALAVGRILEGQGYDVVYTRTTDVYDSPVQKARLANESGADFFVSIHRNSSATPNQYNGVQTLIYNDSGLKKTMALNINKRLEDVGYRNINVDIRPNLAVLRRTSMPAVLVEAGFINSDKDNSLFDNKFDETAQAIADGINETIRDAGLFASDGAVIRTFANSRNVNNYTEDDYEGDNYEGNDYQNSDYQDNDYEDNDYQDDTVNVYQLLVGLYKSLGSATYQMNRLINDGYDASVYEDEGLYQVRVGQYTDVEDALIGQRELRDRGYDTLIVSR